MKLVNALIGWVGAATMPLFRMREGLEKGARVLAVTLLTLGVPVAGLIFNHSYQEGVRIEAGEAVTIHEVRAVVTGPSQVTSGSADEGLRYRLRVRWTGPDGRDHDAPLSMSSERNPGETVSVWIDDRGERVARPPRERFDTIRQATWDGVIPYLGLVLLVGGTRAILRRVVAQWPRHDIAAEWAEAEATWRRRR